MTSQFKYFVIAIAAIPLAVFAGPQELTKGASSLYSLRLMNASYKGPAVTVRRGTDNAAATIGFTVEGTLDLNALRTFATDDGKSPEASAFITTWHDQSANGRHAVQSVPDKQPVIVNAGKLVRSPNKRPSLEFDGRRYLEIAESTYGAVAVVAQSTETIFSDYRGILGYSGTPLHIINGIGKSSKLAAATKAFTIALRNGTAVPFSGGHDFAPLDEYFTGGFVLPAALTQKAVIGATDPAPSRGWKGFIAEIVVYSAALSQETLIALSADQAVYFGIGSDPEKKKLTETPVDVTPKVNIVPTDTLLDYSDFAHLNLTPQYARFYRIIKAGGALENDNPGVRIRFRTSAATIRALFTITPLHQRQDSINGNGLVLVDGKPAGTYVAKALGELVVAMPTQEKTGAHDYEILFPYGQSIDFLGLKLDDGTLEKIQPRTAKRYVAYGDSITHGFHASSVELNYPSQVGAAIGYQTVNMGFGGRHAEEADGDAIAACKPDLVTLLIGFNDRYHSRTPAEYKRNLAGIIARIRKYSPVVPIFIITPIWSSEPAWASGTLGLPLEDYRSAARECVVQGDQNITIVDGLSLMDNDSKMTSDGIHPNDKGFSQIAARLTVIIKKAMGL